MPHISQEDRDEIIAGNDIVGLIGGYISLNRRGSDYVGLCPFHKEKTPSFHVHPDEQYYHCFGCGVSGNAITFLMEYEGLSYVDAVKSLADRINYTIKDNGYTDTAKIEQRKRLYELHKVAARYYFAKLYEEVGRQCVSYLDERALSINTRRQFGLGYSPGGLYKLLKDSGYSDEDILASGLCKKREDGSISDFFYNRMMIPIIDIHGNVIGFGGRTLSKEKTSFKYLNSPATPIFDKSRNLFNLNNARKAKMRELILVEGYMDAITIYQAGFHNVVASLGTAFNEKHARVLKSYADSVILLFDSDEAGVKAVLKAVPVLRSERLKVKVLQVTDAKDPDEFIKKFGAEAFGRLIQNNSKSHIIFRAEQLLKKYDLTKIEDKIEFANAIAKLMQEVDNAIEADAYLKEVSRLTGIDVNSIKTEMEKLNNGVAPVSLKQNRTSRLTAAGEDACRELINLVIANPKVYSCVCNIVKPEELIDPFYIKIMQCVYELYRHNKPVLPASVISIFEDVNEQKRATDILVYKKTFSDSDLEKAVNDLVGQIKKRYIDKQLTEVKDDARLIELIADKKKLSALHISLTNG